MKPKDLRYLTIDEISNLVTNIDTADLSSNFGLRSRGFRHIKPKTIGERDWGTIHRYGNYPANITIVNGFTLFVPSELKDYEVIFGYDTASPPNMRCFVDDATQVGNWTELTEFMTAVVNSISGVTAVLGTFKDPLGNSIAAIASNYLKNFICYPDGVANAYAGLATTNTVLSAGTLTLTLVNKPDVALSWAVGNTIRLYRCTAILPDVVLGSGRGFVPNLGINPHFRFLDIGVQNKLNVFYGTSGGSAEGVKAVTNATNATPIAITVTAHGYSTGDTVLIAGVTGNTNANGTWTITVVDLNTFSLNNSAGNAGYISGGTSVKLNIASPSFKQPLQIRKSGFLSPGSFTLGGAATGWSSFANPDATVDITSIATINSGGTNYAWITSGVKVYSTNDQGVGTWLGWTANTMPGGGSNLKGIWMVDKDNGFAVGLGGTVIKTTNGSAATPTWTSVNTATIGTSDLYTVSAVTSSNVFVAGASGKIFNTANGGTTWTAQTSNSTVDIYTIYFTDATHGQYGGQSTDGLGTNTIHFTTDGSTWSVNSLIKPPNNAIKSIYMVNNTTGFACGGDIGALWYTSDGVNWTAIFTPGGNSVRGYDADTARVAGGGYIYKVTSASSNLNRAQVYDALPDSLHTLLASSYYSQTSGFAVGQSGTVYLLAGSPGTMGVGPDKAFHVEKWGMLPDFVQWGSNTAFLGPPPPASTTKDIAEGIRIQVATSESVQTDGTQFYKRMYVTPLYCDLTGTAVYQEGDPIAQFFLSVDAVNRYPEPTITMYIDPARINKNVIGFRIYLSRNDIQKIPVANWLDDPKTYLQVFELDLSSIGWAVDTTNRYAYSNQIAKFTRAVDDAAIASAPSNISANLGHTPVTTRTYMTPRYAVKVARSQGALIAVDQDDRTARLSAYNGAGVHMDDSFPNLSADNNAAILKVPLLGRGELLGLAVLNNNLVSINVAEAQIFDLIKGFPNLLPIDCVSKRSISTVGLVDAPLGLVWQGKANIYYLPRDGSSIRPISMNLKNFLDGTLLTSDNVTPFVIDDFRRAVIAGYDPTYNDVLFEVQTMKETPNVETISGAVDSVPGVGPIVITATAHTKNVNDLVYITGVQGNTGANGTWRVVAPVTANTFTIVNSEDGTNTKSNGNYISGGTAALCEYLTFRYNVQSNVWSVRYWSLGLSGNRSVKYFSRRNDNTLTVGYANGVLKYPNRDNTINGIAALPYEDDVLISTDGAGNITAITSQSRGIQTLLRINLGAIYALEQNMTLWDFVADYSGTAKGDGDRINVSWFINAETTSYDSKQFSVRQKMPPRGLGIDRGRIERAQIQFDFPLATLTNFLRFELRKIEIGVVPHSRIGNA